MQSRRYDRSQTETDRQTDRHAHCNTTLPYRERIKDGFATALEQHQYDTSIDWLAQSRHTYVQEAYHRYMIRCLYKIIILCCEICSWFRVPKLSSLWLFAAITSAKFSSQGTVTQVFLQAGWLSYDWLTECLYYNIWQTADEITWTIHKW